MATPEKKLAPFSILKDMQILQPSNSVLEYIHSKEIFHPHKEVNLRILTTVLFALTGNWRPPGCLLLGGETGKSSSHNLQRMMQ